MTDNKSRAQVQEGGEERRGEERRGEGKRSRPVDTDLCEMMSSILPLTRDEEHMT